jgi:phage terminase Nu1 subunit (DNA packaging protein)
MRAKQSDLVKRLGVTKGRVSQLVKSGVLRPGADGLFDPDAAERAYRALQGEGEIAGGAGSGEMAELVKLKTELTRAKLEQQKAATELAKIRAQVQRGELVKGTAASAATGRILTSIYNRVDSAPLSFLHKLTEDRNLVIEADYIYRDIVRRAFQGAIRDAFIAERNKSLHERAGAIAKVLGTLAEIAEVAGEDPEPLRECQDFVTEVRDIFGEIAADGFTERLTREIPTRIKPEGAE